MEIDKYEVKKYSKIKVPISIIKDNKIKDYIISYKPWIKYDRTQTKFTWNNFIFLKRIGFDIKLMLDDFNVESNIRAIILLDEYKIPLKLQDYFQLKLIDSFHNYDFFDEKKYLLDNKIIIEQSKDKNRLDIIINVTKNKNICVIFFNEYPNIIIDEKNKMLDMIFNKKKVEHIAVFMGIDIKNQEKLNGFIYYIKNLIQDIKEIDNKDIWSINAINRYINNIQIAEKLYYSFINKNKYYIEINMLDSLIKWKNDESKQKYHSKFIKYITELNEDIINDYKDLCCNLSLDFLEEEETENYFEYKNYIKQNKLTYYGLFEYISNISPKYLLNIQQKTYINQFFMNITTGFIEGNNERYIKLNNLKNNVIYGLSF
jgi:hypothetical protein